MIFIDANVFLAFYNESKPELKKLLTTIIQLRDHLLITQQVVNEVRRNRVGVMKDSLYSLAISSQVPTGGQLSALHDLPGGAVSEWNLRREQVNDDWKSLVKEQKDLASKMLTEVQFGRDEVSTKLQDVFDTAIRPSNEILAAARLRKELGNPPGKSNDPLGDQISWETILAKCDGTRDLWLVTRDMDFGPTFNGAPYLNAYLQEELGGRLGGHNAYVFDALGEALRHFQKTKADTQASLPEPKVLEAIAREEHQANREGHLAAVFAPDVCPRCGREGSFSGGVARPSKFGGWSYHVVCAVCGLMLDTGVDYDD